MKLLIEPLTPELCAVTATPTWFERVRGVRGYADRFATRNRFGGWCWDKPPSHRVEPRVQDAIAQEYSRIRWVSLSTAPPG